MKKNHTFNPFRFNSAMMLRKQTDYDTLEKEVFEFFSERLQNRSWMWFNSKNMRKRFEKERHAVGPIRFSRVLLRLQEKKFVSRDGKTRCRFFSSPQQEEK